MERFHRSGRQISSAKYLPKIKLDIDDFENFQKIQKSTFAFLHTCTRVLADLRDPKAPKRTLGTLEHFDAPRIPKSIFQVLGTENSMVWEAQMALGALLAVQVPNGLPGGPMFRVVMCVQRYET